MKRIFALLMIFMLILSGCKQTLPDSEGVTDIFFAGDNGKEESDDLNDQTLDSAEPVPDDEPLPVDDPDSAIVETPDDPGIIADPDEESAVWYALIRQVDEKGFLANHQTNPDSGLFECWPGENTQWINAAGLQDLQAGDVVAISFDGCVDESYPAGLNRPDSIRKMSNSLETYLEQERLRLEKNTVHEYDFRVILKEYPLYDYRCTPMEEEPDFSAVSPIEVKEERNPENPDKDGGAPFKRVFYITKQVNSVNDALAVIKELMGMPVVLQAWAVPCAT